MKKIITLFFFAILAKSAAAQLDTLTYLKTFEQQKTQYIGQPFSVLKNDLQIQIKFFSPFASIPYAKNKETSTSFSFYFPQVGINDFYLTYPKLEIYWLIPLNASQSDILWEDNNGGSWSTVVANFYANGVIADIKVRDVGTAVEKTGK